MSQDKAAEALGPESIKALARRIYGIDFDDAAAERIAVALDQLEAGGRSAGSVSPDLGPGALFRQLLLAHDPTAAPRA
jgi:hypothetical protein